MKHRYFRWLTRAWTLAIFFYHIMEASITFAQSSGATPVNFKIAFFGDQGLGANARSVLNLIKAEGAQAVLHLGDLDYKDDPVAWDAQINAVLGANFPYFACIGNHDESKWRGTNGYQKYLQDRLNRLGITWEGDLGVQSTLRYQGLFIVLTGPDVMGSGHDAYIRDQLAADNSIWSISAWHKNMELMQVGGKSDETGWEVYEASREGGAIIATAHEHSYSRTHLLSNVRQQTVASRSDTLLLTEGKTFVFVSGLGGESVRDQELSGNWWASIYTSAQGATHGALFGVFNVNGAPNVANFYFKDIAGRIADRFFVISNVESNADGDTAVDGTPTQAISNFALEQNYPNPFLKRENSLATGGGTSATILSFHLTKPAPTKFAVVNVLGKRVRLLFEGDMPAGQHRISWDGRDDFGIEVPSGIYFYRLESGNQILTKKLLVLE